MAESEEELKSPLKVKEQSEKADLKLKIMASVLSLHVKYRGKEWKQ